MRCVVVPSQLATGVSITLPPEVFHRDIASDRLKFIYFRSSKLFVGPRHATSSLDDVITASVGPEVAFDLPNCVLFVVPNRQASCVHFPFPTSDCSCCSLVISHNVHVTYTYSVDYRMALSRAHTFAKAQHSPVITVKHTPGKTPGKTYPVL